VCEHTSLPASLICLVGHSAGKLDRNPAMDRETARRNMRAGLVAGGIAAGIFALSFVAAFLYIAQ
jgi:hypothetical protein